MSGWISLHRKIRQNPVFSDLQLLRLWIICLMEASHKDHKILVGKQVVELKIGEFVTGRFDLHKLYNEGLKKKDQVTEYTVWRWLLTLQELEFVSIKSSTKFSICTVVKWADYQNNEQQSEQQVSNKRAANEQQMSTNNNGNKGNNDNKGNKKKPSSLKRTFTEDDVEYKIASHLLGKIKTINPNIKQPDIQKWSDHVRLMIEQDKRTVDDIRELVKWLYSEPEGFWRTVILSTENFRKKYDAMNTKRLNGVKKPIGKQADKRQEQFDNFKDFAQQRFEEAQRENEENGIGSAPNTDQARLS